jgi:hypothetical protein
MDGEFAIDFTLGLKMKRFYVFWFFFSAGWQ